MPDALAGPRQRWLRHKHADKMHDVRIHKHLSVMTPNRIRDFANVEGMAIELLTGAYSAMVRKYGGEFRTVAAGQPAVGQSFPCSRGRGLFLPCGCRRPANTFAAA